MLVGEKVNKFDLTEQTVKDFNEIFTECKLTGYDDNDKVEIGEVHSADVYRYVTVNGTTMVRNLVKRIRKPHIKNPLVVVFNTEVEKTFNSKLLASRFLGITEGYLDTLRSYDESYKGYYVEFKEK